VTARLGLCCLCAAAIAVLLAPSGSSAPATPVAATSPAVASITGSVNSWIRGALCRVVGSYCDGPWYCQISTRLPANCQPADIWGALFYRRWILYVSLGLAALFLLGFLVELGGFHADPDDVFKISSGSKNFRLSFTYGEVTKIEPATSTVIWNTGWNVSRRWYATIEGRHGSVDVIETGRMPVNVGYDLYRLWATENDSKSPKIIAQVNCFNNAVWWTSKPLVACVQMTWIPMVLLAVLQGLLFRWFSIFTIAFTALLYGAFRNKGDQHASGRLQEIPGRDDLPEDDPGLLMPVGGAGSD
jgi:hypothetical protein